MYFLHSVSAVPDVDSRAIANLSVISDVDSLAIMNDIHQHIPARI